jgi:hypothetical protein
MKLFFEEINYCLMQLQYLKYADTAYKRKEKMEST